MYFKAETKAVISTSESAPGDTVIGEITNDVNSLPGLNCLYFATTLLTLSI